MVLGFPRPARHTGSLQAWDKVRGEGEVGGWRGSGGGGRERERGREIGDGERGRERERDRRRRERKGHKEEEKWGER